MFRNKNNVSVLRLFIILSFKSLRARTYWTAKGLKSLTGD